MNAPYVLTAAFVLVTRGNYFCAITTRERLLTAIIAESGTQLSRELRSITYLDRSTLLTLFDAARNLQLQRRKKGDVIHPPVSPADIKPRHAYLAVLCGGGRNSAMLLAMYERGVVPNIITFADTKGEKPATYEAVARLSRWCEDHFGLPITIVTKTSMYASLEDQSLRTETLPSAAYGWRSCSDKWKIQPQDKFMNNHAPAKAVWAAGQKITKALGYDAGEKRRGESMQENAKYKYWFPLKEWGWYLEDCKAAFVRHGLPIPPKSACFYCPSSTKAEVLALAQEEPELFARSVAIERNAAPNLKTVKGLGRHWTWEELVSNSEEQRGKLFDPPEMNCTCFDSEEE